MSVIIFVLRMKGANVQRSKATLLRNRSLSIALKLWGAPDNANMQGFRPRKIHNVSHNKFKKMQCTAMCHREKLNGASDMLNRPMYLWICLKALHRWRRNRVGPWAPRRLGCDEDSHLPGV